MKSIRIELMQKSFIVSLALSFVFAFTTVAYLSSPIVPKIQIVTAEAAAIAPSLDDGSIPFEDLNIISFHEMPSEISAEPLVPNTAEAELLAVEAAKATAAAKKKYTAKPSRLIIPSIGLDTTIESVGINAAGEMAVPDGDSPNVGWYKFGTIPGNVGSAVIDAHVYAAFGNLKKLPVGEDVIVINAAGERLEFQVEAARVYELGALSANTLFNRKDARRLNLITCAGTPTADGSTYTHRLVVYTTLVA